MVLVLRNVWMIPSNVRKNKETTECDKSIVTCDVCIVQCEDNTIKYEENKETTEYDKSIVTCDVGTAQCEAGTMKCEDEKIREPPNVTKVQLHVILVLCFETNTIKYEEKNKGTTEYDKSTVTCDVGTVQCEDSIIKCEKKWNYQMWQKYNHMWC